MGATCETRSTAALGADVPPCAWRQSPAAAARESERESERPSFVFRGVDDETMPIKGGKEPPALAFDAE
jgi:hypothetical protein